MRRVWVSKSDARSFCVFAETGPGTVFELTLPALHPPTPTEATGPVAAEVEVAEE